MRVLNLTGNWEADVSQLFKDAEIINAKITEALPDGQYDVIYARYCLQLVEYSELLEKVKEIIDHLAVGGELHVITPSLEWIAALAFQPNVPMFVQSELFGSENNRHRSAHTVQWVRGLFEALGLVIIEAKPMNMNARIDGQESKIVQNYVIGKKYADPNPIS